MAAKTSEPVSAFDPETGEQMTAMTVAGRDSVKAVMIGGTAYEVVQQVNVPILKHETGQTVAIRIMLPIRPELTTREIDALNAQGEKIRVGQESEINVARVTELGSGQLFQLVLNAIAASEFRRAYPDDSYVGRCFAIKKLGVVAGKRYKDVQIVEIQPNSAA